MLDLNGFKIIHDATRLKKIWIRFFKETGENGCIWIIVELNIIDNTHKINYMLTRDENFKETAIDNTTGNLEDDKQIIEKAVEFVENHGYA